jgi:glycosyltransferase involved in cell wall biosynthesis
MKILIASDAWYPQVNGVVHTLDNVKKILEQRGHKISMLTPDKFKLTFPLPGYNEIRLIANLFSVGTKIWKEKPDAVHIATEGPIGLATRIYCSNRNIPFTTSYHTKFPEFIHARIPWIKEEWVYKFMRWFHKPSKTVLVTTDSMKQELKDHKFTAPLTVWTRGADLDLFDPSLRIPTKTSHTFTYVGRVSIEKTIDDFLDLKEKFPRASFNVVGDGPDRKRLEEKYPHANFMGILRGPELAEFFASSDVFVFPSKTDTFGIVMIEANACGTPVAAYPVTGPIDYVQNGVNGWLDDDLSEAIKQALNVDRANCRQFVEDNYSWDNCADIFFDVVEEFDRSLHK